jgi:hypothetical protein
MTKVAPHSRNSSRPSPRPASRRKRPAKARPAQRRATSRQALRARRKFLRHFPGGFRDQTYLDWERSYKWNAHQSWEAALNQSAFERLIKAGKFEEIRGDRDPDRIAHQSAFSLEKMALRDAVRSPAGAKAFALALYDLLHGPDTMDVRFTNWTNAIGRLPRRQTRVLTWPLVTVFGFIAQPGNHFFMKPTVTREAARRYGIELDYASRPSWPLYKSLLDFVGRVRGDISDLLRAT